MRVETFAWYLRKNFYGRVEFVEGGFSYYNDYGIFYFEAKINFIIYNDITFDLSMNTYEENIVDFFILCMGEYKARNLLLLTN